MDAIIIQELRNILVELKGLREDMKAEATAVVGCDSGFPKSFDGVHFNERANY